MEEKLIKIKIGGTTTIGSKGQVVIPKEIRDAIGVNPGDSVIFLYNETHKQVGIIRNDNLNMILDYIRGNGIKIDIS